MLNCCSASTRSDFHKHGKLCLRDLTVGIKGSLIHHPCVRVTTDTATGSKPDLDDDDLKQMHCDVTYIGGIRHGNKLCRMAR